MRHKTAIPKKPKQFLLFCALAVVTACSPTWNEYMELAQSLQSDKRSTEAITVYEKALKKNPKHRDTAPVLLTVAELYYVALQDPNQALKTYEVLIEKFPRRDEALKAYERRAQILEEQEDWPAAISAYSELIQRFPDHPQNHSHRFKAAYLHHKRGDDRQAQLELESFLVKLPKSAESDDALFALGEIAFKKREFRKAIEYYERLAQEFPESPLKAEAEYNQGLCYEHLGEWGRAVRIYRELLGRYPNKRLLESQIKRLEERSQSAGRN